VSVSRSRRGSHLAVRRPVSAARPPAPGTCAVQGLALVGVARETAFSLSIVFHLMNYIPVTLVGLAYLSALNLTLGELRTAGGDRV
jgi:hypothetical protein